jgi:phage-related protein
VFVVYGFQQKSKSGIATPKTDREIIRARLQGVEMIATER